MDVETVWAAYAGYHPRAVLTGDRRKLIESRLRDYPADYLADAIHGNHADAWYDGNNDRGTKYHALRLILRDADHIETFAEVAQEAREKKIRAERRRVAIEKALAEDEAEERQLVPPPADLSEWLRRAQ